MEEKPPFLKNWNNVYTLVVAVLVVTIILLYLFTACFK